MWAVKDGEFSIISRGTLPVSPVSNGKDEMALVFKEVDNTEKPDWFKRVMCSNKKSAVTELHKRNWFFEANVGKEK